MPITAVKLLVTWQAVKTNTLLTAVNPFQVDFRAGIFIAGFL
jgi:hypothetical protein